MEISVGLVELHRGEFGVVLGVHALIAEDASDLIDALHTAHDQTLQRQLGGDAHIHINVQRIVMGDERTGSGTAGNGIEHRGFHFDIAHIVQIAAHELDELGTGDEGLLHIGVHHQVQIALTVPGIGVLEAMPLLRQRTQALGEQGQLFSLHRDLTPAGTEYFAFHADDVAQVHLPNLTESFLADLIEFLHRSGCGRCHPAGR